MTWKLGFMRRYGVQGFGFWRAKDPGLLGLRVSACGFWVRGLQFFGSGVLGLGVGLLGQGFRFGLWVSDGSVPWDSLGMIPQEQTQNSVAEILVS